MKMAHAPVISLRLSSQSMLSKLQLVPNSKVRNELSFELDKFDTTLSP